MCVLTRTTIYLLILLLRPTQGIQTASIFVMYRFHALHDLEDDAIVMPFQSLSI